MIYVSHILRRGPLRYTSPALTKTWTGPIDGKCHVFNFTKDNIRKFIKAYDQSVEPYLDPALDLNLQVEVVVRAFGDFEEDNYKNNEISLDALLPINSDAEWPPIKIW